MKKSGKMLMWAREMVSYFGIYSGLIVDGRSRLAIIVSG